MNEKEIKDMIEPIPNWEFTYRYDCSRTCGKSYTQSLLDEKDKKIKDLQQKVEQLEKENKELKQPQVFIDCENMEERYGRDLYEDYLKEKIEQLENIRKEAIEYVNKMWLAKLTPGTVSDTKFDLLNILNKGE